MNSPKTSTFLLAASLALTSSISAHASSMLFLCESNMAEIDATPARQTERVLAFFLDEEEIKELDPVIRAYQEMTRRLAPKRGVYKGPLEEVVALVYIGQGPYVEFENTIGRMHENKNLLEALLNESEEYAELRRLHPAKTLHLRDSIRPILARPAFR